MLDVSAVAGHGATLLLNQQKGENDRRKYFLINLHKRMLLDLRPPGHYLDVHLTESPRPAHVMGREPSSVKGGIQKVGLC